MINKFTIFDFMVQNNTYKNKKVKRVIELFAGIGSQAKALKNIGINFEHYKICEFDKYAVKSYNAIHETNFEPSDITKINGKDLEIVDTQTFDYLLTYSFPCQDLSSVGNEQGMSKGSGTRSGLLWEVERLLTETNNLPQFLLMENVIQVFSKKHKQDFDLWVSFLESLGYSNFKAILNAKDYGIPQGRKRAFMVSILGNVQFEFPKPIPLTTTLQDFIDQNVEDKYFVKPQVIQNVFLNYKGAFKRKDVFLKNVNRKEISQTITTKMDRAESQYITVPFNTIVNTKEELLTTPIRKLTPKECFRLMGFTDDDFERASKVNSNSQLYKQAGNSIVVQVLEAIFTSLFL